MIFSDYESNLHFPSLFLVIIIGFSINYCHFTSDKSNRPELFVGVYVTHYNLDEIIEIADKIELCANQKMVKNRE